MQLPHTVYRTVNLLNGNYYIGVHTCTCTGECNYIGSGNALKLAIDKYGRENFEKEILAAFTTKKAAYAYERSLINHLDPCCYNLCEGGEGGAKNHIPVVWDGVHYPSKAAASRALGVNPTTFARWYSGASTPREKVSFTFEGKTYSSYAQAAREHEVDPSTIKNWVSRGLDTKPEEFEYVLFGKVYRKKSDMARDLGVSNATVTNLLKDPSKYKGYFMIKGKRYSTQKEAAEAEGVWPQTISKWVSNPKKTDCFRVTP